MKSWLSQLIQTQNCQKKKLFQTQETQKAKKTQKKTPKDSEYSEDLDINETFNRHHDWYIPTSDTKKSLILYAVKDIFSDNYKKEPTRSAIKTEIFELSDVNPHFTKGTEKLHWNKLRGFTKAIWCKFKKDKDSDNLEKYNSYVRLANKLWDTQMAKYSES